MLSDKIRQKESIKEIHERYSYYNNVPERGLVINKRPAMTQIDHEKVGDYVLLTVRDPLCAYDEDLRKQGKTGVESVTLIGLCTDICVISNAMLVKAFLPEVPVMVDASCCAGVTPQSHENALNAMEICQIQVLNR